MSVDLSPAIPGSTLFSWGDAMTWEEYELLVQRTLTPFDGRYELRSFAYRHPVRLQEHWPAHQRKETSVQLAYTQWGDPDAPLLICLGGIANTARRWDYLALDLSDQFNVICFDWPGRGMSGWLAKEGDYSLDTNVETLAQLLDHLDQPSATIIGSSLGGSTAMAFAARHPGRVEKLVLNDIGPYMPAERRQRRAQAVAHHYIFKRPSDLFRRLGASAKNDGPVTEDELLHNTYFQTQWSAEHGGRVYRHDPRALQAYAADATGSIDQWDDWRTLDLPILVIHGLLSDALLLETVQQMLEKPGVAAMHVPETGHTPALSDAYQIHFVRSWLLGHGPDAPFTCLLPPATPRHLFTSAKPAA